MVGFCHLTDSHHYHHRQKPTMVGICHGGNLLGNHYHHCHHHHHPHRIVTIIILIIVIVIIINVDADRCEYLRMVMTSCFS